MARAHQIAAQILAGAHQVAQRLLLDARDRDAMQLAGDQQPHQPLGVAPIGLHPIRRRRAGSTPARTPHSRRPPPASRRASTNPVGPASYVARTGPGSPATNAATSLARPDNRRTRNSPESRSSTAATVAADMHIQRHPTS